jgi:hypothetical protein
MGLVSILVSANQTAGSSGATGPAAASVKVSRREMLFLDADNWPDGVYVFPVTFMAGGTLQGKPFRTYWQDYQL